METSPTARKLAARFVAGETLEEVLEVARRLNAEGITVTLDHLGESISSLKEATEARDVYLRTLEAMYGLPRAGAQQPNAAGGGIRDDFIITDIFAKTK